MRSSVHVMSAIASTFARLARRSLPFLARYRTTIVPTPPGLLAGGSIEQLLGPAPVHQRRLVVRQGRGWASIGLNASTLAVVLEGALGGPALFDTAPVYAELTSAQQALINRVGQSLVDDFIAAIAQETSIELRKASDGAGPLDVPDEGDGLYAVCEIHGLTVPTAVVLAASSEILANATSTSNRRVMAAHDPRMLRAVQGIPLEAVAELGRVTMPLRKVLALEVGDVIRLPTAAEDAVEVRVMGAPKLIGMPITSRGQLAIEVRGRHGA